jgi:hypothetical protein
MDYHTYDSLYKTIKEQYARPIKDKIETKQDKVLKKITDTYDNPTITNVVSTIQTAVATEPPKPKEEKPEDYLYIHKNYI